MEKTLTSYDVRDYTHLLGIPGFSDQLLNNHFKLYEGYVKQTNLYLDKFNEMISDGRDRTPEYQELKRRFAFEFDGMRLHEYYFDNIASGQPLDEDSEIYKLITEDFGSFEDWKKDFISTGLTRGSGWVILYMDLYNGKLLNCWINDHHIGHPVDGKALLVMDCFEHAYMLDYNLSREEYINNFFNVINWGEVSDRVEEVEAYEEFEEENYEEETEGKEEGEENK